MGNIIVNILVVGFGSCLGGIARYLVGKLFSTTVTGMFPWATLAVNLGGCFLIGLIYGLIDRGFTLSPEMKLFLTVGFCGGFTTFSTFMHENFLLFGGGNPWLFVAYASTSFVFGLLLVYGGYFVASSLH